MRDLKWSAAEKTIAHKAFDSALRRELETVLLEAGDRAARIEQTSELWNLERWLTTIVLRRLRLTLRLPSPLLGSSLIEEKYCLRSGIDDKRRIVWMS